MRRVHLIVPSVLVIGLFMVVPLGLMAYISVLERGAHGGVVWGDLTPEAYVAFLFERDLMGELELNTDYLQIFLRSLQTLAAQDYPDLDIIVVDDGSEPNPEFRAISELFGAR